MPDADRTSPTSGRADVRRNRRRLLDAAAQLVLEVGGEPTRDAVAARAGVGIATLYRHFPDRQALLRSVALDVLDRTIAAGARVADDGEPGGLRRYLHAAIDGGLGAVALVHPLLDDADWPDRRDAARDVLHRLVGDARRRGEVGPGVTVDEVALVGIRFCRSLAIGIGPEAERELAHRQLDVHLDGLAAR